MTAINISVTEKAAHLFCDTKGGFEGVSLGSFVKCLPIPHLNTAIAVRGPARALACVIDATILFRTGDELRAGLPAALQDYIDSTSQERRDTLTRPIDIFVVQHDGKLPSAFMFFNHNLHGYAAWECFGVSQVITPVLSWNDTARVSGLSAPACAHEALRLQARANAASVGGFIQETIVDAIGIHTRCLGKLEAAPNSPIWLACAEISPTLPAAIAKHL